MNDESRINNSIRNIVTGVGGQVLILILGFISRRVFVQVLSEEYLGVNGLFSNILNLLSLAELGVGGAIVYALYKPIAENDESQIRAYMNFYRKAYRTIAMIIGGVGLILLPFIKIIIERTGDITKIHDNVYLIYLFYLFNTVITYLYSYKGSILEAKQKSYIVSLTSFVINSSQNLIQIFVLKYTRSFIAYIAIQSIATVVNNLLVSTFADKLYPNLKENSEDRLTKKQKRSIVKNVKALMIVRLSDMLVNNTDNIIISFIKNLSTTGIVSNYNMILNAMINCLRQVFNGLSGSVGNLNASKDKKRSEETFNIINFINFWLFGWAALGFVVLGNDVIELWLGRSFSIDKSVVIILAVNFYMSGMMNSINVFRNTMGLFVYGKYVLLITAAINLVLSVILGKIYGLFGVFVATAISRLLTNSWYHPYVLYKHGFNGGFRKYVFKHIIYAIVIILATSLCELLCSFINFSFRVKLNFIVLLIIKLGICVIVPNIIIFALFYRTREVAYLRKLALSKVFTPGSSQG